MYDSSSDEDNQQNSLLADSLNETAHSVHFDAYEMDDAMKNQTSVYLKAFYEEKLKSQFKLDSLEEDVFQKIDWKLIHPQPEVYFLPYTILLPKTVNLEEIRDRIVSIENKPSSTSYNREKDQITVIVHTASENVSYKIRSIKTDIIYHQDIEMLDSKMLIMKLYETYAKIYKKLYFEETCAYILYWAHHKKLLVDNYLTEEVIKLLMICVFINFGYGVANMVQIYKKTPGNKEVVKEMCRKCRVNRKGETQIFEEELVGKYTNYTIREGKGFYLMSKRAYAKIKEIIPVYYPIYPLSRKENQIYFEKANLKMQKCFKNFENEMSLCKNIYMAFKFLLNKFNKPAKLIIDFDEIQGYREEYAETFELEVLHPVYKDNICKHLSDEENGSCMRRIKAELQKSYELFEHGKDPTEAARQIFAKNT